MVFSEENFELEKQMGCMAGIFQIFDRQHLLTGRRSGRHGQKRLPSGNSATSNKLVQNKSSHQAILEKNLSKTTENSSVLSMESSRASCSSSSCSSFSSVNETFYTEKPLKETLIPKRALELSVNETFFAEKPLKETLTPKKALDLRDVVKESINREPLRGLTVKTEKSKEEKEIPKKIGSNRKDSPRPVLVSKSMDGTYVIGIDRSINNYSNNNNEYRCNNSNNNNVYHSRYSCDGRDLGPQNCTNNNYNNNNNARLMKDLPRLSLDSRKESLKKSNFDQSFDSPGQHRRSNSLIARLMGLELLPDLGAEIGEKLEIKTRRDSCLADNLKGNEIQIQNSKFENGTQNLNFENLVVKTKRIGAESAPWRQQEKNIGTKLESDIQNKLREFQKKGENFDKRGEKTPRGFESPIVIMKPSKFGSKNSKSHEIEEKKKSFKQGSKVKQTNSDQSSSNSPRTPPRISPKNRDSDKKLTNKNSVNSLPDLGSPKAKINRPTSPKMKKNLSKKLDQEAEVTTPRRTSNYKVSKENSSEKEMAVVSPVSVLDMSFYQDELTPQKRLSDSFKDGETCTSEESWASEPIKSENIETLIQKLEQLTSANDESPHGDLTAQRTLKNKDHEYIHEILFASGLLGKDLSFIVQSEYPINPDFFLVLEQTKTGDQNQRKLIFDLVNEILARKLESKGPFCVKKLGGERLFEDLCKEIDEVQMKNLKRGEFECGEFEEQDDGFENPDLEMIREMKGWEKFDTEMQMMVFEIEKSIFRDLIDEVVETNGNNQHRIRRQLF